MVCIDIWRPAFSAHATKIVGMLVKVGAWGIVKFRKRIKALLGQMVEKLGNDRLLAEFMYRCANYMYLLVLNSTTRNRNRTSWMSNGGSSCL